MDVGARLLVVGETRVGSGGSGGAVAAGGRTAVRGAGEVELTDVGGCDTGGRYTERKTCRKA